MIQTIHGFDVAGGETCGSWMTTLGGRMFLGEGRCGKVEVVVNPVDGGSYAVKTVIKNSGVIIRDTGRVLVRHDRNSYPIESFT